MTPEQFLARCKAVWHVAPSGGAALIARHGFRTAQQLIDAADLGDASRERLSDEPRRDAVQLVVEGETVVLRDQGPLFARKDLGSILGAGLTPQDWIRLLNRRVYFFTDKASMAKVVEKYVARDGAQEILTISPLRLLQAAGRRLELAAQNTGAIARSTGPQKFPDTFVPVTRFPDRRPAEVTVLDGLPDAGVVVRAVRRLPDGTEVVLPFPS